MIVNDLPKEPFLLVRTHYFPQRDTNCDRAGVRSPSGPSALVTLNLRPHRETGRLGDATLPVQPSWRSPTILEKHNGLRFFVGWAAKKWRLRRSRSFFREQACHPNIDNELRAKQVNTGSTPASRRDAPKIGRRFSAGYLRYAMGPVPEGRDEQTGQR
jgi:hypothetical protein